MRRLAHSTLAAQKHALVGEVFSDFTVGTRVATVDGYPGRITAVLDGPFPGTEGYEVILDGGVGGGRYSAGQLRPLASHTAAAESDNMSAEAATLHLAAEDYPELGTILHDRPPNERVKVYASRRTALATDLPGQSSKPESGQMQKQDQAAEQLERAIPQVEQVEPPDACSFCGHDQFENPTNTGRGTRMECAQCGGTMTSWGGQWQPDPPSSPENAASRQGDPRATINDLSAVHGSIEPVRGREFINHFAARDQPVYDPDLGFHMLATWAEVRRKAKAIRDSGGVRILAATGAGVVGEVQGEHHLYEASYNYVPGTRKVADWGCGCKWGGYAWGRSPAYARFEGRQCSHVTALQYEAQSRGMFGRQVSEDRDRLPGQYQRSPVTVQYDRAGDVNLNRRTVPPGNMRRTFSSLEQQSSDELDLAPVHAFACEMIRAQDDPDAILRMLAKHGVAQEAALQITAWAATVVGDEDGGGTQPGQDIPGLTTRDTTELKKKPHHYDHHTNDSRQHAPDFGRGIGWYAPGLMWCDQCSGSGCGHCGGTGQVMSGVTPTGGPGVGDLSTTTSPVGDESASAGEDSSGGISASGGLQLHQALLLQFTADYAADSFGGSGMDQTYRPQTQHSNSQNPGSTGWATSADPGGWVHPIIGNDYGITSAASAGESSEPTYYHGTTRRLTEVTPANQHGRGVMFPSDTDRDHAYATTDHDDAWHYAEKAWHASDKGVPRVYEVRSRGPVEKDPEYDEHGRSRSNNSSDVRSRHGFDVVREVPMPEHIGTPEEWGNPHEGALHSEARYFTIDEMRALGQQYLAEHPEEAALADALQARMDAHQASVDGQPSLPEYTHAGLALKAADTGRVLMIQRSIKDESDPARGTWEMPGGGKEPGDKSSLHTGVREWEEEVGHPFPEGGHVSHTWRSGTYHGHVVVIPSESQVQFAAGRSTVNPDDPGGDDHEQSAWWHPQDAKKNPALRDELKKNNPFGDIAKAAGHGQVTIAESMRGNPLAGTYKAAASAPTTAELHGEPEPALPSTDGSVEDGDDPTPEAGAMGWTPGDPAPGQYLAAQPEIPWGYPGGPSPAPLAAAEASFDDVPLTELVAAFQATAAGQQLVAGAQGADTSAEAQGENAQIAAMARAVLAGEVEVGENGISKSAMKDFSFAEQQELISEGATEGTRARNFDGLQIEGTHYALLGEDVPEEPLWF